MIVVNSAAVQTAMLAQGFGTTLLAERAGLPHKTVSVHANNDSPARVLTITKLARALGVHPTELVKQNGDKP